MADKLSQSEAYCTKDRKQDKLLVAAIDFGTTFSGYAFSTKASYDANPADISINQKWAAGSTALISLKAPSAVLFDKDKKFHSFGFEAEDKYSNLALDKKHKSWYFFKRFKMRLHDNKHKIHRETEIEDISGKGRCMKAKDVFAAVIKYLKGHLLSLNEKRGSGFTNDDIHWILTVPAIWTESAKQFMREAANKAEIDGGQLSIALEPEAASIYCQVSHKDDMMSSRRATFSLATPGIKYMVIDLGGGTADITIHEKQADGLKEVHKATGGPWGGTQVDEEFFQLLIRIIGAPVFQTFREDHTADYIRLQRELETMKRTITPKSEDKLTITVPSRIAMIYLKENKEDIEEAIEQSRYKDQIIWDVDKMRMDASIFKSLFKPCADKLVNHIRELLDVPEVTGTNIFLMVGGFSESEMMQHAIKTAFPKVTVVVPDDAGLAVVKGAVVFGHKPGITSRKSRYTYGINISPPYDPDIHPEDHRVAVGGVDRCRDVFKKYIHEGELVQANEPRKGKHVTLKSNQKEMLLKIFASEKRDPIFVDEDGSEYLGKVVVKLPDCQEKIRVEVSMMFGKTELAVEAVELATNTKYTAYFDFL